MKNDTTGSYLATHKYVRYLVFLAAFVGLMATMVLMFGHDRVAIWIEGGASSAGFEITNPEGNTQ